MTARVLVSRERGVWWYECDGCMTADWTESFYYVQNNARAHAESCKALHLSRLLSDLGKLETGYRGSAAMFRAGSEWNKGYGTGFKNAADRLADLLRTYREGQ